MENAPITRINRNNQMTPATAGLIGQMLGHERFYSGQRENQYQYDEDEKQKELAAKRAGVAYYGNQAMTEYGNRANHFTELANALRREYGPGSARVPVGPMAPYPYMQMMFNEQQAGDAEAMRRRAFDDLMNSGYGGAPYFAHTKPVPVSPPIAPSGGFGPPARGAYYPGIGPAEEPRPMSLDEIYKLMSGR